jgi:hypothetical protein
LFTSDSSEKPTFYRQIQTLVDEAFADLVEKHRKARPRPHVMAAYLGSHEKFGSLYKKLAE